MKARRAGLLLRYYSVFASFELTYNYSLMGLKSINKVGLLFVINIIFMVFMNALICYLIKYRTDQRAVYYMINLRFCHLTTNVAGFLLATCSSWKTVPRASHPQQANKDDVQQLLAQEQV